jgi:hypothetical protein
MTFAALQTRVNAAVAAKLLTDAATLNSVAITGKFSNGFAAALNIMLGTNPTFTCTTADAGTAPRGKTLVMNTISYIVREAKPDGAGFTVLELEQV